MHSPYLLRTAAVVTLAAAAFTAGWMGTGSDEVRVDPAMVSISNASYEPSGYFPASYELKPNPAEPEVYEY